MQHCGVVVHAPELHVAAQWPVASQAVLQHSEP